MRCIKPLPALLALLLFPLQSEANELTDKRKLAPIKHIVVVYLENHSFDNLMGLFPGADGINEAGDKAVQNDADGKPYAFLPRVLRNGSPDRRFPDKLANKPFLITRFVPAHDKTGDLVHRYYQLQEQMDGGRMDRFALASDAGGLTMGYYSDPDSPLWRYARRYTLADHFFTAALGGSMLNHLWLVCACSPRYEGAPGDLHAALDGKGRMIRDGSLSPDGYVINTIQPQSPPFDTRVSDKAHRLPPVTLPTIGDRLSDRHISWAWYAEGWDDLQQGRDSTSVHHQPFIYFAPYVQGSQGRAEHLKDEKDFIAAIENGALPAVSFYKPGNRNDMHPGYARLDEGEAHAFELVKKIEQSPEWRHTLVIVTFDDAGGFWDHVPPPEGDRFGPGERVPALFISPLVKKGFIDHTIYDTTSILKLIETRFSLRPLAERDAKANDIVNALE